MVLYSVSAGWTWSGVVSVAGAKFRFSTKARAKDTPGTLWVHVMPVLYTCHTPHAHPTARLGPLWSVDCPTAPHVPAQAARVWAWRTHERWRGPVPRRKGAGSTTGGSAPGRCRAGSIEGFGVNSVDRVGWLMHGQALVLGQAAGTRMGTAVIPSYPPKKHGLFDVSLLGPHTPSG